MGCNQNLTIIYIISLLDLFAVGLTIPLIGTHLLSLGASRTTIGITQSVYSLLQVVCSPFFGSLSDTLGRKYIFAVVTFSCSILYFLLGFPSSVSVFILLRIILGSLKHTQTLCKAVIVDIVHDNEQIKALGFSNGLGSLGFVLGPLIGGYLFEHTHGFFMVCSLTSLVFLCNLGLVTFLHADGTETKLTQPKQVNVEFSSVLSNFKNISWRDYWDGFLLRLLYSLSVSTYFSSQSLYLQQKFGLSQRYVGITISFFGTISLISSFFFGYITKIFYKSAHYYKIIQHFYLLMTLALLGLYLAPNIYIFYFLLLPYSVSNTALRLMTMELLFNRSVKDNNKGYLAGASTSITSMARLLTPVTTGITAEYFGEEVTMLLAVVPAFFGTFLTSFLYANVNLNKEKQL